MAGTTGRQEVVPALARPDSDRSCFRERLVKTGGRLIKHAWYYWLRLAESHLTQRLFGGTARRIAALAVPAG